MNALKNNIQRSLFFFRNEKFYTILFLCVIALSATSQYLQYKNPAASAVEEPSAEYQNLKQAEERMKTQIRDAGSVDAFFKENPNIALLVQSLVITAMFLLLTGAFVLTGLMFRAKLREDIRNPSVFNSKTWTFSMLFKVLLLFVVLSLSINAFLSAVQTYILKGWSLNFVVLIQTTLADILCLALMLFQIKKRQGSWASLGFRIPKTGFIREVFYGVLGYCCVFPLFLLALCLLLLLIRITGYEPAAHPLVDIFLEEETRSPFIIYYSIFLATIIAPLLEEVFFRGFCFPIFKKEWGIRMALILSSIFFALIHQNAFAFLPICILGFGLAYLYEKRQSLIAPVTMHFVHNSLFIAYFFIVKKVLTSI